MFEVELDRGGFIPLHDDFESSRREPRSCAPPVEIVKERRTNEVLIDLPAEPQATENAETSEIQAFRSVASRRPEQH